MEKLKNENSKKIEIKIEGDNCIVSYPSSKIPSVNEVPTFPQFDNEFKSTIDLNLSLSSNSEEDFILNLKEIKKNNKDYNKEYESNSKKKLEITNKSIFYSDSNLKFSPSEKKKKINLKIRDNKNKECLLKNSVIKKLNFDLCEVIKDIDNNKKLSESDRTKNKSNFLYKNKNLINNYNINNIFVNNNNKVKTNNVKKRRNSMINYELDVKNKEYNSNKINLNINHSFIRHRPNNSFVISNPFNNNFIYLNNLNAKNSEQHSPYNKGNITLNNKKSKQEIKFPKNGKKKFKSPKLFNKKRNIKNNLDKLVEEKTLIKSNYIKFRSTGNFSQTKKENKSKKTKKKDNTKINKEKNNKTIKSNNDNKNIKILNKNNSYIKKAININNNKKNMFCIKKPNKKIIYLTSHLTNKINTKLENNPNNNKKNEYCSLKQYYRLKSPHLLNMQGTSNTPITSTNGCTNCTNCTNSSTLNSPSTTTTKIIFKSNFDEKINLMKYYSQNSFLKNIFQKNINHNNEYNNENKNLNLNQYQIFKYKNGIEENKNKNLINKNKSNYFHKKSDNNKSSKISEVNQKILNKCKTKELQNIIKSNNKSLHKILTERNLSGMSSNSSYNNKNNFYVNNSNIKNNNDLNEIKKMLLKKKLDKKFMQNIKNKNIFY